MSIADWGNVLFVIRDLNHLRNLSYFDFKGFCESKGLDYVKLTDFLEIANSIINKDTKLVALLKEEKRLLKQLESLDPDDLVLN